MMSVAQALRVSVGRVFRGARGADRRRSRPALEGLERRLVLYSASGNAWPHPQLITISFMPDGTNVNGYSSNLMSTFNKAFGSTAAWENVILKAAQTWAAQTNINFAVVPDDGADNGSGADQQGDPEFGDIRIGGYNFGAGTTLAQAYMPPPVNNFSIAGDVVFNTGQNFHIGSTYDLFTVAAHEIGHALGLNHSTVSAAEMYSAYGGVKNTFNADDIAGIRSIYSAGAARSPDVYNSGGASDGSFATAADLTGLIAPTSLTALVTGLNLATAGQAEYFKMTVPQGTAGALGLTVQSQGLSLLAPKVTVYAADQTTVLGSASGAGQYGTTLSVNVPNLTAGQTLYVVAQGADTSVFSTGAYALTLNFGTGASPTVPVPNTATPNGNPISGGGGVAEVTGTGGRHRVRHPAGSHGTASDTFKAGSLPAHPTGPAHSRAWR